MQNCFAFVGGGLGKWRVSAITPVRGEALAWRCEGQQRIDESRNRRQLQVCVARQSLPGAAAEHEAAQQQGDRSDQARTGEPMHHGTL